MAIKVGCFALIDPFATLDHQLSRIKNWNFNYADVTDNGDGSSMGIEYGWASVVSLDANPFDVKRLFDKYELTISAYCAHANLLDPIAPWVYSTPQVIKAVRAAAAIGVRHVITTEGDPKTAFGQNLTEAEALFLLRERLYEPLRMAADYGVKILLEPHGLYTDAVSTMEKILDLCDSPALGVNLDTGNLWLGGGDPVEFVARFRHKIEHVHWKDHPVEMVPMRGKMHGTGMAAIPLGTGCVPVTETFRALEAIGYDGYSTLEIAGDDAVLKSYAFLQSLGAE